MMTLLYQLIPAEGAKPRGKVTCPRPHSRPGQADSGQGEEDMYSEVREASSKPCPNTPSSGTWCRCVLGTSSVETASVSLGWLQPGQHLPTLLVGSELCSQREL